MLGSLILKELRVTEKATQQSSELNQYTFVVSASANKYLVTSAVKSLFNVRVLSVNIINRKEKTKRGRSARSKPGCVSGFKKAIVSLPAGEKIELL